MEEFFENLWKYEAKLLRNEKLLRFEYLFVVKKLSCPTLFKRVKDTSYAFRSSRKWFQIALLLHEMNFVAISFIKSDYVLSGILCNGEIVKNYVGTCFCSLSYINSVVQGEYQESCSETYNFQKHLLFLNATDLRFQ